MEIDRIALTFVRLADTLVDDFDVLDVLHELTTQSVELLRAAAAGLLLADRDGALQVTMASSERARLLDLFQLQNDEGPCLECYRTGVPVGTVRLDAAGSRWPRFAPTATGEGFATVLALPLRLRGRTIGALNLFGDSSSPPIGAAEIAVGQALADVATITILQDRLSRDRDVLTEQLQLALESRVVIEQAKGALANALGIGTDAAFELLRQLARRDRRRLVDVAEEVMNRGVDQGWQPPAPDILADPEGDEPLPLA